DGEHTFAVRAVGDPTPATRTFTTGETGPRGIDLAGPPERNNDTTPTFTFAADEAGATFECRLEAPGIPGTFAPCTTPWTYPALADARYTLTIRAREADGNVRPDATCTFTLDATPPDTFLDHAPPATVHSGPLAFAV